MDSNIKQVEIKEVESALCAPIFDAIAAFRVGDTKVFIVVFTTDYTHPINVVDLSDPFSGEEEDIYAGTCLGRAVMAAKNYVANL